MTKMCPVVHFQMPASDKQRMAQFYESAFGWQTKMLGEEMGHYVLATTTDSDEKGPKRPGAINGGFFSCSEGDTPQHPSIVIAVEEIATAMQEVTKAGGKILGEPMQIPGVGSFVAFNDTEGNTGGMLQPLSSGCA